VVLGRLKLKHPGKRVIEDFARVGLAKRPQGPTSVLLRASVAERRFGRSQRQITMRFGFPSGHLCVARDVLFMQQIIRKANHGALIIAFFVV